MEILFEGRQEAGLQRLGWSAEARASGIYLLGVQTDHEFLSHKMALIK